MNLRIPGYHFVLILIFRFMFFLKFYSNKTNKIFFTLKKIVLREDAFSISTCPTISFNGS